MVRLENSIFDPWTPGLVMRLDHIGMYGTHRINIIGIIENEALIVSYNVQ